MTAHKNGSFPVRLGFALRGLGYALRTERSLQIQVILFLLLIVALIVLEPGPLWWALTLLAGSAVITAELFNTAIERLADEVHPQDSPGIAAVKDCAAAAVLIAAAGALAVAAALLVHLIAVSGSAGQ